MTQIKTAFWLIVIFAVVGLVLYLPNKDKDGDDGVRVTFTVQARDFKPGQTKPVVHYRMMNVAPQPEQLSDNGGILLDNDGWYRKSLGVVKKGTYVMVWATLPEHPGLFKDPFTEIKLYFDGSMVCQDTNVDGTVVCEKEVV